nr:PREDICTED: zinc finger protein SNAI2-like isoform X2 [Bemisia tabaci]
MYEWSNFSEMTGKLPRMHRFPRILDDPSLDSIFENTTPAAALLIPPPGYVTDESFDVREMLDPSFGQNAPSDILELPLNSPIPTSPVFPSSALRPSYGQNPPSPQITPYSGYIQGGEGSAAPSSPPRSSSGVRRSPSGGEGGAPDTVDWRCPECGKSYHNKETIYAHKYNHFAVRKGYTTCRRCRAPPLKIPVGRYVCDICGDSFGAPGYFKGHLQSHTGETVCPICWAFNSSPANKTKHLAKHHQGPRNP